MRVIAGKARRLALKTVPGMETRPTTDRIKETLFNILQPEIPDCRFLDLFSGSGGIGIEALSRGAESAVFVEKNPKACACIRENLTFTKLAEHGKLLNMDVLQALRSLEGEEAFDCIFMDPPYNKDLERQVLEYLKDSSLANTDTLIVTEADLHTDFSYVEELGYELVEINTSDKVYSEIASHVDIFTCKVGEKIIVEPTQYMKLSKIPNVIKGKEEIQEKYPFDIKYNVCTIGKKAIHNFQYTDSKLKQELINDEYELINTTQGYTNCSIAVIDSNSAIV